MYASDIWDEMDKKIFLCFKILSTKMTFRALVQF